ncbi:hypothetical protein [uncultured Sphingomonas sp.]|uniref:hypothetical protein n=1 Tax=uncultured Sphingomonas sp. TaxID=158754 RepID=UPI00259880F3|nr:hypothetical protein [uncultured Sphingomonas sp.]
MDERRRQLLGAGAVGLTAFGASAGLSGALEGVAAQEPPPGSVISVTAFGARGDGTGDDGDALRRALAWASDRHAKTAGATPRLYVPGGIYPYEVSPNFAVTALALDCAPGVVFYHRGAGSAFVLDGGARTDGTYRTRISGAPVVQGNARSTIGLDVRALHHAFVSASVRDVAVAALRTRWAVGTEFRIRTSGLGIGGNNPNPVDGVILDARAPEETTSDCLFHLPIIEQVRNVGIRLVRANACTFVSGTLEANGMGGVHVEKGSNNNLFIGLDLEFNGRFGILCEGNRNGFLGVYDDKLAIFAGVGNWVRGNQFNAVVNRGDGNAFEMMGYAAAAGTFTDTGTNTHKMLVRNLTNGQLDVDHRADIAASTLSASGVDLADREARNAVAELTARLKKTGVLRD